MEGMAVVERVVFGYYSGRVHANLPNAQMILLQYSRAAARCKSFCINLMNKQKNMLKNRPTSVIFDRECLGTSFDVQNSNIDPGRKMLR